MWLRNSRLQIVFQISSPKVACTKLAWHLAPQEHRKIAFFRTRRALLLRSRTFAPNNKIMGQRFSSTVGQRFSGPHGPASDHTSFSRQLSFRTLQRIKDGPRQVRAVAEIKPINYFVASFNSIVREEEDLQPFALLVACRQFVTFPAFTAAGAYSIYCQHRRP